MYQIGNRILNNLLYILKGKGTKHSLQALMNCYGISDSMIKIVQQGGISQNTGSTTYQTIVNSYAIVLESGSNSYLELP